MPATAARLRSRRLAAVLAMLTWVATWVAIWAALAPFAGGQAQAQIKAPATRTKPLLVLPTDNVGLPAPPVPTGDALDAAEAGAFPLGLHLGMTPEAVNNSLAHPLASVAPEALTPVSYLGPDAVVSFAIPMSQAGDLRPAIVSCFGATSQIVFQFDAGRLYTISFRFARDGACLDPRAAADELYQRLLAIPFAIMPSSHYRVGDIDVVDAWDPSVSTVIRRPWRDEP
jgi:hypothetical protein